MASASSDEVQDIVMRLRRIEGQVRGLQRMIEESRDCEDIITQLVAVRAALDKVGLITIQRHIDKCVSGSPEEARQRLRTAMELLLKVSH
jgi:DNA-binding FrmR family transcriptional regulator